MTDIFEKIQRQYPTLITPYIIPEFQGTEFTSTFYNYISLRNFLEVLKIIKENNHIILGGVMFEKVGIKMITEGSNWSYQENITLSGEENVTASSDKAVLFFGKVKHLLTKFDSDKYFIELVVAPQVEIQVELVKPPLG